MYRLIKGASDELKQSFRRATVLCLLSLHLALPAKAQVETIIGGVIGGAFLLDKAGSELRSVVDRAETAGLTLLERGNAIAKERLKQVDDIVKRAIQNAAGKSESVALNILAQAKAEVLQVEKMLMIDLQKTIWQAECGGRKWLCSARMLCDLADQ